MKLKMGDQAKLLELNSRQDLACRRPGVDPDIFFPDVGNSEAVDQARRVCRSCPAQKLCAYAALEQGMDAQHGIWGGVVQARRRGLLIQLGHGPQNRAKSYRECTSPST